MQQKNKCEMCKELREEGNIESYTSSVKNDLTLSPRIYIEII